MFVLAVRHDPGMLSTAELRYAKELLKRAGTGRPLHILTLGEALGELSLLAEEVALGRPAMSDRGERRSLHNDVMQAMRNAGPSLRRELKPDFDALRAVLDPTMALFDHRGTSENALKTTHAALIRLIDPAVAQAALHDLASAVRDGSKTTTYCAHRAQQFREISERRGHWWDSYSTSIARALKDSEDAVMTAAAEPAPEDAVVVWLAFADAVLSAGYRRVGPIQLFDGSLTPREMREGSGRLEVPGFTAAWELPDDTTKIFGRLSAEQVVLVRVEVTGANAITPALDQRACGIVDWARAFASDVIAAASFRFGGNQWRLLDGGIQFDADGDPIGVGFTDPTEREMFRLWVKRQNDDTCTHLGRLDTALIKDLAAGAAAARHALNDAIWHQTTSTITDPAQRIGLRIRGFERQFAPAPNRSWQQPLVRYLCGDWTVDQIDTMLQVAGWRLHTAIEYRQLHPLRPAVIQADEAMYSKTSPREFEVNLPAVMRHAPLVARQFPAGSLDRRLFLEIARRSKTGATLHLWMTHLGQAYSALVHRSARQRNSILHGRQVVPPVLLTVDGFLADVSAILAATALHAHNESIIDYLARSSDRYKRHLDDLENTACGADWFDLD
jgi:hypothetical protein